MFPDSSLTNTRSSVLWNTIEPGDPYDIRKSMIARLPDHRENFMGTNLEIVCLMQAAEIERLNAFLAEFKMKYFQVEKRELDRHSYQIQIKQLSQKANQASKLRIQNEKLHAYIKKQTTQYEQQSRKFSAQQHEQLISKYNSLLRELQSSRQSRQIQTQQVAKLTEQNKELRMKYDRLDKLRLTQLTQERQRYEVKMRERIEIQLKQSEHKYTSRIYELQSNCNLYKQQMNSKNHQISTLQSRIQLLRKELQNKEKLKILTPEAEMKIKQLQQINYTLSRKASELERIYQQYTRTQQNFKQVEKAYQRQKEESRYFRQEIERLKIELSKNSREKDIEELQNKLALLSSQLERLTLLVDYKTQELIQYEQRFNSTTIQYQSRVRQLTSDNQLKASSIREWQHKTKSIQNQLTYITTQFRQFKSQTQYLIKQNANNSKNEKRIVELEQQLKKAYTSIGLKNEQITSLEAKIKGVDMLNSEVHGLNRALKQKQKIIQTQLTEIQNYTLTIKSLQKDAEQTRKQFEKQQQISIQLKRNYDSAHQFKTDYEDKNIRLQREANQLRNTLVKFETDIQKGLLIQKSIFEEEVRRRIEQYRIRYEMETEKKQQKSSQLEQKLLTANQKNRLMEQQINGLQQKISRKQKQSQQQLASLQSRFIKQIQDLTNSLKAIRQQNEKFSSEKNNLRMIISDLQKKLEANERGQAENNRQISKKFQQIRSINEALHNQSNRLKKEMSEIQQKTTITQRETQQRIVRIYNNQLQDKDNIIAALQRQIKSTREQIRSLQANEENSNLNIKNYRDRLLNVSEEIDRLNEILTKKNRQIQNFSSSQSNYQKQIKQRQVEISQLRKGISQKEILISQLQYRVSQYQKQNERIRQFQLIVRKHEQEIQKMTTYYNSVISEYKQKQNHSSNQYNQVVQNLQLTISQKQEQIRRLNQDKNRDWQERERNIKSYYESFLSDLQKGQREKDQIHAKLLIDVDNLQKINQSMRREIQVLRRDGDDIGFYKQEKQNQIRVLKLESQSFLQRIKSFEQKQMVIHQKIEQYELIIKQLQKANDSQVRELNRAVQEVVAERDKLRHLLQQYQGQIKRLQLVVQKQRRQSNKDQLLNQYKILEAAFRQQEEKLRISTSNQARIAQITRKCQQFEAMFNQKMIQIDQFKRSLNQKDSEIINLKNELSNLQFKKSNDKEAQISHLKGVIDKISYDCSVFQNQVSQNQITIRQLRSTNLQYLEVQKKYKGLQNQIQNLLQMISQLQQMNSHLKAQRDQLFRISHEYKEQIDYLNKIISEQSLGTKQFQSLKIKYNEIIVQYTQAEQKLKLQQSQIISYSRMKKEYEIKLKETADEIERLTVLLKDKESLIGLINQLREKNSQLAHEYSIKSQEAAEWSSKYNEVYQIYHVESDKAKGKLFEYEKRIKVFQEEFTKISELVKVLKSQNEQLRAQLSQTQELIENVKMAINQNKFLSREIDRLTQINSLQKIQISDIRLKLIDQMALEKRLQQCLALMVILFAEIQTLRNRVSETQKQCENVRRSSLTPHRLDRQPGKRN